MKSLFTVLAIFTLSLTIAACGEDEETISIMAPSGSPSLSQTYFEHERPDVPGIDYEIDIVAGAEPLGAAFGSESHDIIFAPTNLGARLAGSNNSPYQLGAVITWGNLYLASGRPLDSLADLDGEEIRLFGENATPDIVTRSLLAHYDYDDDPDISYVDAVDTSLAELRTDPDSIGLLAEPALSVGQDDFDELHILDLQEVWAEVFETDGYPQAGIFIKESVDEEVALDFLEHFEISAEMARDEPGLVAEYAENLDYDYPREVLEQAIPRSNIHYMDALESREDLETFFERILDLNPELIGGTLPDDDFYFDPQD